MFKHKLFQVLYATVFLLIALELVARVIWGTNSTKLFVVTIPDFILHHKTRPNFVGVDDARSIPYTMRTNSQSWIEDYDVAINKPAATFRIFYVGDSNTVGLVDSYRKMVEIVELELNKIYKPQGRRMEVINTGTASWSPLLYYLFIKTELIKYDPDLVVINVDMTDVPNDAAYRKTVAEDKDGKPVAVRPNFDGDRNLYKLTPQGTVKISRLDSWREELRRFLISNSVVYYYFEKLVYKIGGKNLSLLQPHNVIYNVEDKSADWLSKDWNKDIESNVDYTMSILGLTLKLLQEKGIKVALTGVPHAPQFTGEWSSRPFDALGQTAEKYGIPYLNTYEEMKKYIASSGTDAAKFYWKEDPTHLNIPGNALWAKIQLEFLLDKKNELLP